MITADTIREAVDRGWEVHWSNGAYVVEYWKKNDEYVLTCVHNNHSIGLTWSNGETLNGQPDDFYAVVTPEQLDRNPNGTFHCPQCRCVVILFDEDNHICTLENWKYK